MRYDSSQDTINPKGQKTTLPLLPPHACIAGVQRTALTQAQLSVQSDAHAPLLVMLSNPFTLSTILVLL